jgi:hypothetical protein
VRVLRFLFFAMIVFLALPEFVFGVRGISQGMAARGDIWSVQHSYFGAAWVLLPDLAAVAIAGVAAFRPIRRNWALFLAAAVIVLFLAVNLPSWYLPPEMRARSMTMSSMRTLQHAVDDWSAERGSYPRNAMELERALKKAGFQRASPFQRKGEPLEYQIVIDADAHDPVTSSERPGVLHYAVRLNGSEYWITATTLPEPVSDQVVMMTEGDSGPPWVLTGKLAPPAPVARPKAAAKKKK